ncbi:2,3,4,5-tetrahydropyridine-2,6-dicarboxylate N-succinyltransferase [Trichinella pseudospiralis]
MKPRGNASAKGQPPPDKAVLMVEISEKTSLKEGILSDALVKRKLANAQGRAKVWLHRLGRQTEHLRELCYDLALSLDCAHGKIACG